MSKQNWIFEFKTITNQSKHISQINLRTSRFYGSVNGKPKENLRIAFDLDADLTPLFNWNTKQVFVYLTGSYNDTKSSSISSEVTFWDKIITEKADAHVILKNVKSKYAIWDAKDKISEKDLDIKLHWNIQPWVGTLVYGETTGETLMTTPAYKKNSAKQKAPQKDASN